MKRSAVYLKRIAQVSPPAATKSVAVLLLLALLAGFLSSHVSVLANGDDDHSVAAGPSNANVAGNAASIVTAERNIQNDSGQFTLVLKRSPSDPRAGEVGHFLLILSEKVEGGFAAGPVTVEKAAVRFSLVQLDGGVVAENLPLSEEPGGVYRGSFELGSAGDYKLNFNVTTADGRTVAADFPIAVSAAPIRSSFWIGFLILLLLTSGLLGILTLAIRRRGSLSSRTLVPVGAAALLILALGTLALGYLVPPREIREIAALPLSAATAPAVNALLTQTAITIPKESQILFGIKTQLVGVRQITSGLKTTGVVRARPNSKAIVTAQVPGRVVLNPSVSLGAAVGRGERIGFVEQVLDVSGQTELESQRLDVEAQQRDVEARRLELRNTVLTLQSQQAQSRASAQQSRTRLAQAQRELRRSQNLVEVGAVPRKRVEEAQTAVKVAEEESAGYEKQVALIGEQIKSAQAGQSIFRSPTVRQPSRIFPLIAPVTGTIDQIMATSGQQVASGAELINIVNLSTVLLDAQVFEKDLSLVRESTRASFTSAALGGEVYTMGTPDGDGRLLSIGQTVNEQSRTVSAIYEVKNPFNRLKDGNFVEITIDTSGDRQVLAVPKSAVVREQGETFVFVFDGGESFVRRPVVLGAEGADFYEVSSGVTEGERVVIEGVYQLRTTQPDA